jgi:hypothetical protein
MEASMIHTLFWLTGIVTWLMIALACALWLGTEIHERSVIRRARNGWPVGDVAAHGLVAASAGAGVDRLQVFARLDPRAVVS